MTTDTELRIDLAEMTVLDVQPGDKLVLSHPGRLSDDAKRHIRDTVSKQFPGHIVIVLEEGMTLAAVRPAVP